ncbi:PREDICTED: KN motif and ankyrin repeat domain-containing protein 2 isoform X1 [Trachymyrmex cornetzi]|uniref:KN motif and ankyrin repeat domain-containing protein 2 isoform X1 n=1 Tax=Trachymyrmex cornetzi TaxID=471704 RepID=UPI00084ED3B3|nr:PREDICTED: KN motif and ankyrin repeat domain-containing protein 2 isoform X1 [Trachymyrmex cornetzi]XP_018362880.1 PREDICTED: KN motif and ankyrin repeat domain-containing protein 2 isoform X1 [Trachymyrmex cornetzi]
MALTVVPSTRVFNGNVGTQAYVSGSKCLCCPYGYHIDLDFVRYCEAVAAGSAGDRPCTERRKKRERRRQCQSMEVLLGLVSPALAGIEAELPKIPQECTTANGLTTLPRSNHPPPRQQRDSHPSPIVDLSDVVGDFEATLKRSCRSSKISDCRLFTETDGTNGTAPVQNAAQTDQPADSDNASVGSGNSNLSTGALQNIREQMAASLERMKELEEQVKAIPMLQVQVSVLKEEKRNLLRQVDELSKTNSYNDTLHRHRSQSFSEQRITLRNLKNSESVSTRDIGTMCGVMTRDVGVSYQPVRTRDVGMITSTPIKPSLQKSHLRIEEIVPEIQDQSTVLADETSSNLSNLCDSQHRSWKSSLTRSQLILEEVLPERKKQLTRTLLQVESIPPNENNVINRKTVKKTRDFGINTENKSRSLEYSHFLIEDIAPEVKKEIKKRSYGTTTRLSMKDLLTKEDAELLVEHALRNYKNSLMKDTFSRSVQCSPETPKVVEKRDRAVQVTEQFRMRSHASVTAKPMTSEVGIEVKLGSCIRSIGVGPDPVQPPVSLNWINLRSHSFNYGDTRMKTKASKSVAVMVEDLVKTIARGTDTSGLTPKCRDFGTSTMKKTLVDVSVGDSVRPHISISCAANYCDNCKETIKSLAKQIANNAENSLNHQNSNMISRIPRPSHIPLNTSDYRRQFKRQDTYTKIAAAGVIRYDADNKEQYDSSNRIQQLQSEKIKDEKIMSEEMRNVEKETDNEEKSELPESALFQPIQDKPRKKVEPSKEMQAAMKVLNDSIKKSPSRNISHQLKNATNIIQQEWFKISSTSSANPLDVEDYLDRFEECSSTLLEYIVNMTDTSGNTAMHYAVSHGNFDVVSILLDSKVCDINKANVAGYTAVMLAALAEVRNSTHASVANRLFQLADVNIRAKLHGQTALMLAVSHGRKDMTQLLLDAGAAVNIQDEDGSTALMCAAEHGHTEIVRLLLAHPDCDPSIVDVDGSSALKIALEAGNRDIGVLLYAHEHVNRGISPYSTLRRSRRGSKPTTPTGPSPSAPASPAPSRRIHSSSVSLNTSKYSK